MTLRYYSAPFGYAGPDRLDITRKSADAFGLVFAPSWALLAPALETRRSGAETAETWVRYVDGYADEMRASYRAHRASWDELLERPRVVAVCYCRITAARPWCHRRVLGEMLAQLGAEDLGELAGWQADEPAPQLDLFGGKS